MQDAGWQRKAQARKCGEEYCKYAYTQCEKESEKRHRTNEGCSIKSVK